MEPVDVDSETLWNAGLAPTTAPQRTWRWYRFAALWVGMIAATVASTAWTQPPPAVAKLTFHGDPQRSGWNARETVLTPANVAGDRFGLLWQSPVLDGFEGVPPLLFASPLYVPELGFAGGAHLSVAYVVTTSGYVYAINTSPRATILAGTILWRKQLTDRPCGKGTMGNLSTPGDRSRHQPALSDQFAAAKIGTGTSTRWICRPAARRPAGPRRSTARR